ncbi:Uncharacterised protein [Klebsiella michiganensis]|nr:Uncharacterised protein [Klebsiella michiganensis]
MIERGEHHVIQHRAVGKQIEALDTMPMRRTPARICCLSTTEAPFRLILAVKNDLAAVDAFKGVNGADQGGLAGAGRADDADYLAVFHFQVDAFQYVVLAPGFFDGVQIQRRRVAAGGLRFLRLYRRLQVLAQGFAFMLVERLRALTLNIQQVFQRPEQPAKTP